jgi:hypothetical protein
LTASVASTCFLRVLPLPEVFARAMIGYSLKN